MKKLFTILFTCLASTALAQDIPNHSVAIGGGSGFVGFRSAGPCTSAQVLGWPSGVTADPTCGSIPTGSIPNNFVTNALLAQMPTSTVKCNPTTSTATPIDCNYQTINVRDYGAVADGVTDNTTAITNAYNAVVAKGGGTLYFPASALGYVTASFPTISSNGITIKCETPILGGSAGTLLQQSAVTGDFILITGTQNAIDGCSFMPTVRKTSGSTIVIANAGPGVYRTRITGVRMQYVFDGINVSDANGTLIEDLVVQNVLGNVGINYFGSVSIGSFELTVSNAVFNNSYPLAYNTVRTWAQSTAFTAGQIIFNNGAIYQCTTSGTSSGAGTGPNGLPSGTTPVSAFTNTITDGTAQWKFVAKAVNWIIQGNYAYTLKLDHISAINGASGLLLTDNASTGTSFPQYTILNDVEVDHPFSAGIQLNAGYSLYSTNGYFSSSLQGDGVNIAAAFKGASTFHSSRVCCNWLNGFNISAHEIIITDSAIHNNSVVGSGTANGITVAAGVSRFIVSNNRIGKDPTLGTNNQGFGVAVATGGSDIYSIVGNVCGTQNVTSCVSDAGTGTTARVRDNIGYNPIGPSAITVGASPFTYTAGHTPETVYVQGGTVSNISHNGTQVFAQSNATVHLEPNETVSVTYSVLPAMNRMRH
jgi:Pectate lyase superfamily protein